MSSGAKSACSLARFWYVAMRPEGGDFGKFQFPVETESRKIDRNCVIFCVFVQKGDRNVMVLRHATKRLRRGPSGVEIRAPSMKGVVVQLLALAVFHVEHSKNKNPCVSSTADSFSLFAIFAVLGSLRQGF
jgi:hypothetical protein